jgi:hypothetical protein
MCAQTKVSLVGRPYLCSGIILEPARTKRPREADLRHECDTDLIVGKTEGALHAFDNKRHRD